jgi:hypothetical protein
MFSSDVSLSTDWDGEKKLRQDWVSGPGESYQTTFTPG